MPLLCCCLKARPAGEESREEWGEAVTEGEREVTPLLKVPEPEPEPRGTCTMRECGCEDWRSLFHRVTLFVPGSVVFAGAPGIRAVEVSGGDGLVAAAAAAAALTVGAG